MADEEPTREELMNIVKKFMQNAPPGEFMEVVTDIRGLVEDESIINDVVGESFEGYNLDQMLTVDNGDHKVIICREGCVNGSEFLDPVSQEVVSFDHITRKVTSSAAGDQYFGGGLEEVRQAVQKELEDYVADHYATGVGAAYGGDDGVTIAVSAAKFEPRNFWTGSWRAVWQAQMAGGAAKGSEVVLKGKLKLSVHFYEDGNVQLNATNDIEVKAKAGASAAATAQAIFKAINVAENKYQNSLEAAYATMDTSTFKALRRQLPVTASKIDWDKIGNQRAAAAGTKRN